MAPQVANVPTTLTLNNFIRTGYTFVGWNTLANGTGTNYANGALYSFSVDITLYAKWTANSYTITFNSNGGSAVGAITQPFGSAVSAPTAPTKTGHTFGGWYSDAGLTTAYTFTTMPAADITLYAKWTVNSYTITFNSNGGSAVAAITQPFGSAVSAPTAPTKTGNTFGGWYSDAGLNTAYTFTTMPASNITLYAKWTANSYTITFNSNGGSAVAAITQPFGSAVSAPTAPTKTGNTFGGWYSDAGLTTAYTFTTMPAADITLYAKWTVNNYTITFNSNGGSAVGAITQPFGSAVSARQPRPGHTFLRRPPRHLHNHAAQHTRPPSPHTTSRQHDSPHATDRPTPTTPTTPQHPANGQANTLTARLPFAQTPTPTTADAHTSTPTEPQCPPPGTNTFTAQATPP
ncbi:MAG: InlB B-repeat-containing protein [Anaerolineales bacterium]|nr:InlB B-repeat-containing protein [Anaerolineales bacterium]